MNRRNRWPQDHVDTLLEMAPTSSIREIAVALGRTPQSVREKCYHLDVRPGKAKAQRLWSPGELRFLRQKAGLMSVQDIASALGRTAPSVQQKAVEQNIKLMMWGEKNAHSRHSDETVELCRQLHEAGMSRADISEKMEVPAGTVSNWLSYISRKKTIDI